MTEKHPVSKLNTISNNSDLDTPHYIARRVGVLTVGILVGFGLAKAGEAVRSTIEHLSVETKIASEVIHIPENGTVITSAVEAIEGIATVHDIPLSEIPFDQVTYASQTAKSESLDLHNRTEVLPGDSYVVTLSEVGSGYGVSVIPAELLDSSSKD